MKKNSKYLNTKKTKADQLFVLSQTPIKADASINQPDLNYEYVFKNEFETHPCLAERTLKGDKYDLFFLLLYNSPITYTKFLQYVDDIHNKHGYLAPINPKDAAKELGVKLIDIARMRHYLNSKGAINVYPKNVLWVKKILVTKKIIKKILVRHPSVTLDRPLGFAAIYRLENQTKK